MAGLLKCWANVFPCWRAWPSAPRISTFHGPKRRSAGQRICCQNRPWRTSTRSARGSRCCGPLRVWTFPVWVVRAHRSPMLRISSAVASHPGLRREENEDSYCVRPELGLYLVADGMGGHAAGEIASKLAVEAIEAFVADT